MIIIYLLFLYMFSIEIVQLYYNYNIDFLFKLAYYIIIVYIIFNALNNDKLKEIKIICLLMLTLSIIIVYKTLYIPGNLFTELLILSVVIYTIYNTLIKIHYINIEKTLKKNDFIKARKYIKGYYFLTRSKFEYNRLKGKLLLKQSKIKESIYYLSKAITFEDSKIQSSIIACTYRDLAIAYGKIESIDKSLNNNLIAIKYFEKNDYETIEKSKEYIMTLISVVSIFISKEKYVDAKKYIEKVLKLDKENYKALYFLIVIKFEEGLFQDAEKLIFRIINKDIVINKNSTLDLYFWLIKIYSAKNEEEKKLSYLFKGIKLDDGFYIKYKWPKQIFNIREEKIIYDYLKKKYGDNPSIGVINSLIYLSFELGKEDEIIVYIESMEKYYPEHNDIIYWKIIYEMQNDNFDKARGLYKKAVSEKANFYEKYTWEETIYNPDEIRAILEAK